MEYSSKPFPLIEHLTTGTVFRYITYRHEHFLKLHPKYPSKVICGIIGPRAIGKSTLINAVFDTSFDIQTKPLNQRDTGVVVQIVGDRVFLDSQGFDSRGLSLSETVSSIQKIEEFDNLFILLSSDIIFIFLKEISSISGSSESYLLKLFIKLIRIHKLENKRKRVYFIVREIDTVEDCLYNIHYLVTSLDVQLKKYFQDRGEAVILSRYISYDFLPMRYDPRSIKFEREDQARVQAIVNKYAGESNYVSLDDIQVHLEDDFQILTRNMKKLDEYYERELEHIEEVSQLKKKPDTKMQLIMSGIAALNLMSLIAICTPNDPGESNKRMLLHNIVKFLGPVATIGMLIWIK